MAEPLDLDMIRKMEGPQPERWVSVLCDEIERLQADFVIAIGIRERIIEEEKRRNQELLEDIALLFKKYSKR